LFVHFAPASKFEHEEDVLLVVDVAVEAEEDALLVVEVAVEAEEDALLVVEVAVEAEDIWMPEVQLNFNLATDLPLDSGLHDL